MAEQGPKPAKPPVAAPVAPGAAASAASMSPAAYQQYVEKYNKKYTQASKGFIALRKFRDFSDMISDVTPVDPNFRVTKKVLDGLSQLVSVADNIGSIGRSFNDLAYFVNTTKVDGAKKDQDQLLLGL